MIEESVIKELLRLKGMHLYHREGQELEFKEQFNLAGLADYFRDFAAFSNNRGGYLVFGVKDSPRVLTGLSRKAERQFDKIDPETEFPIITLFITVGIKRRLKSKERISVYSASMKLQPNQ